MHGKVVEQGPFFVSPCITMQPSRQQAGLPSPVIFAQTDCRQLERYARTDVKRAQGQRPILPSSPPLAFFFSLFPSAYSVRPVAPAQGLANWIC